MRISDWSSDVCSSDLDVASMMASLCGNTTVIGEAYNVAGAELTSVEGSIRLMAKAVGVEPDIVHVPMELARRARPPLLHWGEAIVGGATFSIDKALRDTDWKPAYNLEAGYRSSYEWFDSEGRDQFEFDFSGDDRVLAEMRDLRPS